jgi:ABC-type dipeptide/oligopeptide/nickel transport system ATPase subunit
MSDHMHVYMTLMMVGDVVGGQISDGVRLGLGSESGSGVATVLVVVSGSESETASGSM